jgi:hypothetical protein
MPFVLHGVEQQLYLAPSLPLFPKANSLIPFVGNSPFRLGQTPFGIVCMLMYPSLRKSIQGYIFTNFLDSQPENQTSRARDDAPDATVQHEEEESAEPTSRQHDPAAPQTPVAALPPDPISTHAADHSPTTEGPYGGRSPGSPRVSPLDDSPVEYLQEARIRISGTDRDTGVHSLQLDIPEYLNTQATQRVSAADHRSSAKRSRSEAMPSRILAYRTAGLLADVVMIPFQAIMLRSIVSYFLQAKVHEDQGFTHLTGASSAPFGWSNALSMQSYLGKIAICLMIKGSIRIAIWTTQLYTVKRLNERARET